MVTENEEEDTPLNCQSSLVDSNITYSLIILQIGLWVVQIIHITVVV